MKRANLCLCLVASMLVVAAGCSRWVLVPSGTDQDLRGIGGSATSFSVVGANGTILSTEDSGRKWTRRESSTSATLRAVTGIGPDGRIAVGDGGTILVSKDAGRTWKALSSGTKASLVGVVAFGETELYVISADGSILHSTDAGAKWTTERLSDGSAPLPLRGVAGVPSSEVWVAGRLLVKTVDAGKTWTAVPGPGEAAAIWCRAPGDAVAVRDLVLFHTTSGGASWRTQPVPWQRYAAARPSGDPESGLQAISGDAEDHVLAVGESGLIVRSDNGGVSWWLYPAVTDRTLRAVWGNGVDGFWAVGDGGVILKAPR